MANIIKTIGQSLDRTEDDIVGFGLMEFVKLIFKISLDREIDLQNIIFLSYNFRIIRIYLPISRLISNQIPLVQSQLDHPLFYFYPMIDQ